MTAIIREGSPEEAELLRKVDAILDREFGPKPKPKPPKPHVVTEEGRVVRDARVQVARGDVNWRADADGWVVRASEKVWINDRVAQEQRGAEPRAGKPDDPLSDDLLGLW
jgi:hypothetical protein